MAIIEILLPKMGESVAEATITKLLVEPGSSVETDDAIVEIDQDEPGEFEFHLKGIEAGTTTLELFVLHEGHVDVRTIEIPIIVE